MTDEQRTDLVEDQLEMMYYVCKSFAEVDEEDNARAIYEEYAEWIDAQQEDNGSYEVMWAPNFTEV